MIVTLEDVREFLREDRHLIRHPSIQSSALNAYEFDVCTALYSVLSHDLNAMRQSAHAIDTTLRALQDLLDKNP